MAKLFHKELSELLIHFPGSQLVNFGDDESLEMFFQCQYPNWKAPATATSIPTARLPRLFLKGNQITDSLEKRLFRLQKGESGEIDVYTSLLKSTENLEYGILVLPNVDGNHFKSKVAHVELDTVVVHPRKGVFVFNVKNAGRVKEKTLCEDMVKHCDFIRLVQSFEGEDKNIDQELHVPVHGVICSLQKTLNVSTLESCRYYQGAFGLERRFVIQPDDIPNFSKKWFSILSDTPDAPEKCFKFLDRLAARLGSLNSMEGSVALIHNQISGNHIQKMQRKPKEGESILTGNINVSLPDNGSVEDDLKKEMMKLQIVDSNLWKMSFILWTSEQQKIISYISMNLLKENCKPCKVIVCGPKGSGKTMMLSYIARLTEKILITQGGSAEGKVCILDGRGGGSQLLFEQLTEYFQGSEVHVSLDNWAAHIPKEDAMERERKLKNILQGWKMVIFDECIAKTLDLILSQVNADQHMISFTSLSPDRLKSIPGVKHLRMFQLTYSLRATCEVAGFAETFRILNPQSMDCGVVVSHNLRGSVPHIRSISMDEISDPFQNLYVDAVVEEIGKSLYKCGGLRHVLVTPFVHQITLERVISRIQKNGWSYEYRNPIDRWKAKMVPSSAENSSEKPDKSSKLPRITFLTGNNVDGVEYGSVIILLERSLPCYWEMMIMDSIFIALTRATTQLSVILNDSSRPPLIYHKKVSNDEAVPRVWRKMPLPSDVDIPVYNFVKCDGSDEYSRNLEQIIKCTYWSRSPILVLGKHECLNRLVEIEQPSGVLVDGDNISYEIKWYQCGDKTIVSAVNYESTYQFFIRPIYMDLWNNGFSALVFLAESLLDIMILNQDICRHRLMYHMYEEQHGNCPIYILSSCDPPDRKSSNLHSLSDFLVSHSLKVNGPELQSVDENMDKTLVESWKDSKEIGNLFLRNGNLESALTKYNESVKSLKAELKGALNELTIDSLINMQDELAKLHTNISKALFDIAVSGAERDVLKMELSRQHAEKSVKLNPYWIKGYHRISEAIKILGEQHSIAGITRKKHDAANTDVSVQYQRKRDSMLELKLKSNSRWEMIKFKDNVVLVDSKGEGHFRSISEALLYNGAMKPISLLVNPGVYEEQQPLFIRGSKVDIIGNCAPECSIDNQWVLDDPPVVIQSQCNPTIVVMSSTVSLSMVSIYNWRLDIGHSLVCTGGASVSFLRSAFKSMCGAAVAAEPGCQLYIEACRSFDSFGAILALANTTTTVTHTFIQKTKAAGLEFRDIKSANVEHCSISFCEKPGIAVTRGTISVNYCLMEGNAFKKTINEGSIQLGQCDATVLNTSIINQIGNGIVIQQGCGSFRDLTIERCRNSGILVQAPSTVTSCSISNCMFGIVICSDINGNVIIEDCDVSLCTEQVAQMPLAIKPIIRGKGLGNSKMPLVDRSGDSRCPNMELGRLGHERSLRLRDFLLERESILDGLMKGDTLIGLGCVHCSVPPYMDQKLESFLCPRCDSALFCSRECFEKDAISRAHHGECINAQQDVKAYRNSIGWFGGDVAEGGKSSSVLRPAPMTGPFPGGTRKYRGAADLLQEKEGKPNTSN